jgi:hypothetical protein
MRGVMENIFQLVDPFFLLAVGLFVLRLEINVIETDQEKFSSCPDGDLVHVLRGEQKQMTVTILEFVFIDAVGARTVDDINQFKEVVLMGWFKNFIGFFIYNLEGVVEVLRVHTCKSTE